MSEPMSGHKATTEPGHWLFLRGLARERGHWGGFVEDCARQLSWPRCHTLELPGCGELWQQESPLTVAAIRQQLQQRVAALGLVQPYGIVALSLGGMVALDWLRAAPADISHTVLINTSTGDCPPHWRLRAGALGYVLRAACSASTEKRERQILRMVSRYHRDNPLLLEQWCEIAREHPVARANLLRQLAAAARYRFESAAPETNLPVQTKGLILASLADAMVSYRCSARLAAVTGWPLYLHRSAGHDLPLDRPDWVIATIRAWWETQVC